MHRPPDPSDRQPASQPTRQPNHHAKPPSAARRTRPASWTDRLDALDLRRVRDREATDRILERAAWLDPEQRALIETVLRDNQPISQVARATGLDARVLRRRFAVAVARALDDRTAFVAHTLPHLSGTRARVAEGFYLHGRTLRAIAADLRLSLHTIRAQREVIEAMYQSSRRAATIPNPTTSTPTTPTTPNRPDRRWQS